MSSQCHQWIVNCGFENLLCICVADLSWIQISQFPVIQNIESLTIYITETQSSV